MSYTCFKVDIADKVATIELSRPDKRNSMILEFWEELPRIVRDIDDSAKARVIVISSTGPHFSSGIDLGVLGSVSNNEGDARSQRIASGAHFYQTVKKLQTSFTSLEECRIPVLAAIQGGCIGGGVDLATACDMRYATEDAFFSVEEINVGMTADVGTFPRLVNLIPEGIVRELCYTGRRMPANEAQAVGLVNRVYADHETLNEEVMKIAAEIASKAPLAVYGCKRMINYSRDHSTQDTLDYVGAWNASMFQPDEVQEAIAARTERRAGNFVDLPRRRANDDD